MAAPVILPAIEKAAQAAEVFLRPKRTLGHREFARKYVRMPDGGPHGGEKYRDEWQPVIGVLWDELDRNYWKEVVVTGPVQASKSFGALVVPTLRDIAELKYSPILGVPEADMFADKWDRDFKPVLEASDALRWMLPTTGSGQRGGRVRDRVTFGNGTDLKVMSRGGQATNKAGYTTPRLRITEAAGFSDASTSERDQEADSYRQLLGRLGAFDLLDPRRLVAVEGTLTTEQQLPYRLRGLEDDDTPISTRSRLVAPCPHCEGWISPGREHLVGWQGAKSVLEVLELARFVCPLCGMGIDDAQRRRALQDVRIVHFGQEIAPDGTVTGPLPPVLRLWFAWEAWHNCLINAGTVAVAEWEAAQIEEGTVDRENAERDLCQKKHAVPFKSTLADNEPLNPHAIRRRTQEWQRGVLPSDTVRLTVGIDVGKWTSWWLAVAYRENGAMHVPAYGAFDVMRDANDDLSSRILQSLREFNDSVILAGFPVDGSDGMRLPDGVGIDVGYQPDDVAKAIREFSPGVMGRWQAMRGRGNSMRQVGANNGGYNHPKMLTKQCPLTGNRWYMEMNLERGIAEATFDADYWLLHLQDRLRAKIDSASALTFYRADMINEHAKVAIHLAAEHLEKQWDPKKGGLVEKWVKNGMNHLSDAAKMALVMGDVVSKRPKKRAAVEPAPDGDKKRFRPRFRSEAVR